MTHTLNTHTFTSEWTICSNIFKVLFQIEDVDEIDLYNKKTKTKPLYEHSKLIY